MRDYTNRTDIPEDVKRCLSDLHWMARRYADGRMTYAVSMFNEWTDMLRIWGVPLSNCDGTLYAEDGNFGKYKSPLDAESEARTLSEPTPATGPAQIERTTEHTSPSEPNVVEVEAPENRV